MCEETSIFRYLYPGLLSEKDILDELKARCSKTKGLERKSREELTQIFINHLLPLPQRKFPDNHHGRIIIKMIENENQFRKRSWKAPAGKSSLNCGSSGKRRDSNLPSAQATPALLTRDRLKPPIDSERTQTLSKNIHSYGSSLDRVEIKDGSQGRNECTSSDVRRLSSSEGANESKKVEQKRSCSTSKDSEAASPAKRARQRIAWP